MDRKSETVSHESDRRRLELEPGRVEWIVFNPEKKEIAMDSLKTNEPYAYIPEGPSQ
jgi:hypothetical protein